MTAATTENPDALANELSDLIATESRGLLRHIAASNPYVDEKTYKFQEAVVAVAEQSNGHIHRLTDVMESLELSPRSRTYDMDVTYQHYVTAASVADELLEEKREQIAAYERAIANVNDAAARRELEQLLAENRNHLQQLQDVAPKPA